MGGPHTTPHQWKSSVFPIQEFNAHIHSTDDFMCLGRLFYETKPLVLTLNYDILLESAIESASFKTDSVPNEFYMLRAGHASIVLTELTA